MTRGRSNARAFPFAALLAVLAALASPAAAGNPDVPLVETPSLADRVRAGDLPPVGERVPAEPSIVRPTTLGTPGGELRILMGGAKDTRLMVVYGYARLVRYTPDLEIEPDLLAGVTVEGGRDFTLRLRRGHRWSDGQPFTAEDFRYWWEDVILDKMLSPTGPPPELLVEGERPQVEFRDEQTVRYRWTKPNPLFLPALAGPSPLFIYRPAHYLKQFNRKYADPATLDALVKKAGQRNWAALHNKLDNQYRNDNPDLPTLEPWVLKTRPPADRFIFERNAFYHRIDNAGRQLPYIDRVAMAIADSKIIPMKAGAGEADLQARYLRFDHYTFLREAEERNGFSVRLWRTASGSHFALYPNLNARDPVWRGLMRDVRFRRALSLAVDRHEINQVIYYGLAVEGQDSVLPLSPLYESDDRWAWAAFDPRLADQLLDEMGLGERRADGTRLLPDGRPLDIIVESAGESTEATDILELIRDSWRRIGVRLFVKPSQLQLFRNRVFSGETVMSIDKGLDNGLPIAALPPSPLAPTTQQQLQWPKWGQYYENHGHAGEKPDMPAAIELLDLYRKWFDATTTAEQTAIWRRMLAIRAAEVFTIGLVAAVPQPVVVSNRVRNVPAEAVYNWDPGAHFGIYQPDTFWLAPVGDAADQAAQR